MYYVFHEYSLDTQRYELCRGDERLPLRPKVFELLAYLLAQRERVVSKEELLVHLWPGQFVSDATLNSCLMAARKAVGDSGQAARCIHTLHRRGYRFVAPVQVWEHTPPERALPSAPPPLPTPSSAQDERRRHAVEPGDTALPCTQCQRLQTPDAMFCSACGARLMQECARCGFAVRLPATQCSGCGQSLAAAL